jgi:uncharacterized protein (DUF1015 family)
VADIRPLRALHYAPADLQQVVAPPYDVIDAAQKQALLRRSEHNIVAVDLPADYDEAARTLAGWVEQGVLTRDDEPAVWALEQDYTGPDGTPRRRRGVLCLVRVTDYGPGRIRPHERTHAGPKEDRLKLTRATRTQLSPIFSLFADPDGWARAALDQHMAAPPWGEVTDEDGTHNRLWRVADPTAIDAFTRALAERELLIADGHHRYETARVYADEVGGEGPHRWVLMCLVALEDPGLTVFPTHRLVRGRPQQAYEDLATTLRERFDVEETDTLTPGGPPQFGYLDAHFRRRFRLTLKAPAPLDPPLDTLDTAVLEELVLKGPLGLTDEAISHLEGLGYARDEQEAVRLVERGEYDLAFLLRPTPVEQVREVAAAGVSMPQKSTYFFPKVPTGLVLAPLS